METKSPQYVADRAKKLRKTQTPAEEYLWRYLRNRQLDGHKFYRQHPIGKFIVDFYCPAEKLIIELDGDIHDNRQKYDETRDNKLKASGFRVVRFRNEQVLSDISMVLNEIRRSFITN